MRRFALTNMRDFGMGKKACEDKIADECHHLTEVFQQFRGGLVKRSRSATLEPKHSPSSLVSPAGKPFDTTQPVNYAVSNIICSIVYGSRFEYDDPEFTSLVDRVNRNIQLAGSPAMQVLVSGPQHLDRTK